MLPATTHAQFTCTTNNGSITITGPSVPSGSLGGAITFPSSTNGYPVTSIGYSAFAGYRFSPQDSPNSVSIPCSITNIGAYAFAECLNLDSVTISDGIIGDEAFEGIDELTNVTMGHGVTSIGEFAFDGDPMQSVTIPDSVTNFGDAAFYDCEGLANVTIGAGCASIPDGAFYQCFSLEKIVIPATITAIGHDAFYNAGLVTMTIPGNVTSIGDSAFYECPLTNLLIPDSVTNLGPYAFEGCGELTNIAIGAGITAIEESMFEHCSALASVTIGGGIADIGQYAFLGDVSLPGLIVPASVTNLEDYAFQACIRMTNIFFLGNAPTVGTSVFDFDNNTTVYYLPGATGWSNTFAGRPAVLWNPLIQTGDGNFGMRSNQFGFNITGTANIPIVVDATAHLASPVWTKLQAFTLTNGSCYFNDPQWTNFPSRYYRISLP
jgi:BspA type Leucine rich repeat region (6 copies)